MSCKPQTYEGDLKSQGCKCHKAVLRAYGGLVDAGQPEKIALEAAKAVYKFHHPEDCVTKASLTVERWLHEERLH